MTMPQIMHSDIFHVGRATPPRNFIRKKTFGAAIENSFIIRAFIEHPQIRFNIFAQKCRYWYDPDPGIRFWRSKLFIILQPLFIYIERIAAIIIF